MHSIVSLLAKLEFFPDRVIPAAGGNGASLWIYTVLPKEDWVPHSAGDFVRPEHPGSAIKYGDRLYELMRVEETTEGGYEYRYCLRPWDPQDGVSSQEYTRPRTPDRQKAVEDFTHRLDLAQSFALVWGIYPRADQLRLQQAYQYDALGSSTITAGAFLIVGHYTSASPLHFTGVPSSRLRVPPIW